LQAFTSLTFYFMLPTYTMEANASLKVDRRVSIYN
jgi:hypothetical protein